MDKYLQFKIKKLQNQLVELVMEKGSFTDLEVLKKSTELDVFIVEYLKLTTEKNHIKNEKRNTQYEKIPFEIL